MREREMEIGEPERKEVGWVGVEFDRRMKRERGDG